MRYSQLLLLLCLFLSACGPAATPIVIQDNSGEATLTARAAPTRTPSGPTRTPTMTPTPYSRPTEDPALALDQPVVRVGDEMITLGQFRQRVRYERFAALDNARRLVERIGLDAFQQTTNNPTR